MWQGCEAVCSMLSLRRDISGEKGNISGGLVVADVSLLCLPKRSQIFLGSS